MLEDKELIKKAQKGDEASFALLYDKYIKQIYRFTVLKVNSQEEAEDITHDVFLSAWQNLGSFKFRGFPLSSWLYRIARNKIIDYYRANNVAFADLEEVGETLPSDENLELTMDLTLNAEALRNLIKRLNPDQQDVLIMRFVEDLSYDEIARALNKTEGAVRIIQHRALNTLRQLAGDKFSANLKTGKDNDSQSHLS